MDIDDPRARVPSILWMPVFVIGAAVLYFVDVFQIQMYSLRPISIETVREFSSSDVDPLRGFSINTPGCKLPAMDPFDSAVKKYIELPEAIRCNKGLPALFEANDTSIYLSKSSLGFYNITDASELQCCYHAFWRVEPKPDQVDNLFDYSKECYSFNVSVTVKEEFVKVSCTYENNTVYVDMFAFVPLKNGTKAKVIYPKPLDVLVVGLDAVSRLNLHRQMPKTLGYLKKIGSVELLGYNKVGDNTFPNLIPVLTGLFEDELKNTCWPKTSEHFDNCTFLWKHFKSKGYVTAYGEDSSWMGLFNYQRHGFRKQPTDYAYNYFNRKAEEEIGNSHRVNINECEGARLVYKDLLDYIRRYVAVMYNNGLPYFGFFWGASLSHDFLNKPKLGDDDYYHFFKSLQDKHLLNNTALIFMSDHGIRWGGIRQTFQGRMEERLPFVIVHLPPWYRQEYKKAYSNLKRNARRLTTPFDLHETLMDLLQPYNLTDQRIKRIRKSRGISFFTEISKYRTCEDAGIVSHWCACQQTKEIDRNSSIVTEVANFAVEFINSQLDGYAQCANLTLVHILNARLMTHYNDIVGVSDIQDYMITIRTMPGEAIFEITVRWSESERRYSVIGTISRLNLYGKQSACITDFHLKLYCYCKHLLY